MKLIVCIKQVPDPEAPQDCFVINPDTLLVEPKGIPPVLSLFDENALEAALRIKDAHGDETKIVVVSMGKRISNAVLQKALAVGADELVKVEDEALETGRLDSHAAATVLAEAVRKIGDYDLILTGRQAADWNAGQVGMGMAQLLGLPAITLARKVSIEENLSSLDTTALEMVRGIISLSESNVKEIMVPRIDVVSISLDTPIQEIVNIISDCGHSRFPVYHDTVDNIVGMLYAKDLLHYLVKEESEIQLDKLIRPAYFVPESKKLDSLLREFQRRRVHIAVVVDEYGGTSGIVCLEDIIEEIVGEIQDEFDNETEELLKISEGVYLCDARVNLEWLNEKLDIDLPSDDFDTLGGFVFDLFGKIPIRYEKMSYNEMDFIIQNMEGHKIETIKLVLQGESD